MPYQCFMLERVPSDNTRAHTWRNPATGEVKSSPSSFGPGALWRAPYNDGEHVTMDALWVMLPKGAGPFCMLAEATDSNAHWTVTGEPPNITVTPSINAIGYWHGFLTNGVLSDG